MLKRSSRIKLRDKFSNPILSQHNVFEPRDIFPEWAKLSVWNRVTRAFGAQPDPNKSFCDCKLHTARLTRMLNSFSLLQ